MRIIRILLGFKTRGERRSDRAFYVTDGRRMVRSEVQDTIYMSFLVVSYGRNGDSDSLRSSSPPFLPVRDSEETHIYHVQYSYKQGEASPWYKYRTVRVRVAFIIIST